MSTLQSAVMAVVGIGLEWDREAKTYREVKIHPTLIQRDNQFIVSAEDGKDFADYYGEYRGGFPYINPDLIAAAKQHGGYWEWENPGSIVFVKE